MTAQPTPILLTYAFRPFFLLAAAYALLSVLAWLAFLFAGLPLPLGWSPLQWHSHEMLYGFVTAAIAGFLLTAICNWTGASPLSGGRLLGLILLWLAGRIAFWLAGWLPAWMVAAVDLLFLPVLTLYVLKVLLAHGNRRNLILVAALSALTLGNVLMHWGFTSGRMDLLKLGQSLGLDVITLLMVVIAGRITPAFSANWLRAQGGNPERVIQSAWVTRLAIASVVVLLLVSLLPLPPAVVGAAALAAAAINSLRLWQWAGWRVLREPLLWILHLAYGWIVVALWLRGLSAFSDGLSASLWQHTLALGGIGTLILGVMSRVAMGHTGRSLTLLPFGRLMYAAMIAATVLRVGAADQWLDYRLGVTLSALLWVLAFALFLILYTPVLVRPRPDGRPG